MSDTIKQRESLSIAKEITKSINRFKGEQLFLEDIGDTELKRIELSIPSLNLIFSDKLFGDDAGFALGKVYNFWGQESAGKTALAAQIAAELQQKGMHILWVDAESSFDPKKMKEMYGLNAYDEETMAVSVPDSIEDATDIIDTFISSNSVDLVIVDSLTGLGTELIQNQEGNANTVGAFARRTSAHMSRLTKKLKKTNTSIIYINQIRSTSNGMGGFKNDTTGGNAMKFFAHIAVKFHRSGYIDGKKFPGFKYGGHYTTLTVTKSKISTPFREVEFRFEPGKGFSLIYDIFNLAKKLGVVNIKGSWIYILDEKGNPAYKIQGIDKAIYKLTNEPELFDYLLNRLRESYGHESK